MAWRRTTGRSGVLTRPTGRSVPTGSGPAPAGPPTAGVIGPRQAAIPRGRAVLGGLLIAAAAVVVFAAVLSSTSGRTARYVVASRPLAAGTIIGPGDTTTESIGLPTATSRRAFGDPDAVIGRTLSVAVGPGELIQAGMLTPAGGASTLRPVSIAVDSTSLAGLSTGTPVDVLATASSGSEGTGSTPAGTAPSPSGPQAGVEVVLRGASLLSVSQAGSSLTPASSSETVVTLGVATLAEAETLVGASHSDTITLVQAEPSDGIGAGPGPGG